MPTYSSSSAPFLPVGGPALIDVIGPSHFNGTTWVIPTMVDAFSVAPPANSGITTIFSGSATATEDFFGVSTNPDESVFSNPIAVPSGVPNFKVYRGHDYNPLDKDSLLWRAIQPTGSGPGAGGEFVWDALDQFLSYCLSAGKIPQLCLTGTPDWAVTANAWAPNTVYSLGQAIDVSGAYWVCKTAGTSGANSPNWVGWAPNSTVSDGTATWDNAVYFANNGGYGGKSNLGCTLMSDYYLYAAALAQHVKDAGFLGVVYEIANEFNLKPHWIGSNNQLANMCDRAYSAIIGIDSSAKIIAPSLVTSEAMTNSAMEILSTTYSNLLQTNATVGTNEALWKYCDAISFHAYNQNPVNIHFTPSVITSLLGIRSVLSGNNKKGLTGATLPIYDTESGTAPNAVQDVTIAARLLYLVVGGVKASTFYSVSAGTGGLKTAAVTWNKMRELLMAGITLVNQLPNGNVAFKSGNNNYLINWKNNTIDQVIL